MPKLKTHKGAAKRFKQTNGGYKHKQSFARHILTKKDSKRKRQLRGLNNVKPCDVGMIKQMLCTG